MLGRACHRAVVPDLRAPGRLSHNTASCRLIDMKIKTESIPGPEPGAEPEKDYRMKSSDAGLLKKI